MARICQKCFDGPVGSCTCAAPQRPWEPSQHEVTRREGRTARPVTPRALGARRSPAGDGSGTSTPPGAAQ